MAKNCRNKQVESIFVLLLESGALYSAIWVSIVLFGLHCYRIYLLQQAVVVAWQIGIDDPYAEISIIECLLRNSSDSSFWTVVGVLIGGCLVPLVVSCLSSSSLPG